MIYASVYGINAWVTTGNSARRASAALAQVSGNRGTGQAAGEWLVDGGLIWNGVNVDSGFQLDYKVRSVSDDEMRVDAHDSSLLRGEQLPAGGYKNLRMKYAKVNVGMFSTKSGYYLDQRLCTIGGTCLTELFLEEGQAKLMIYASGYGINAWVTTGNSARRASAALAEVSGNRGTGQAAGEWLVDGGLIWNGINVDSGFRLDYKVRSVSDDEMRVDAHDSSLLRGEQLPAGGYKNLRLKYAKVNVGMWCNKMGY